MKKIIKPTIVILLLAAAGAGVYFWLEDQEDTRPGIVKVYGNVEMRDTALGFLEQDYVTGIEVEEGDQVEAGDLLARLDTSRLDAQLAEARATVTALEEVLRRLRNGTRPQVIDQAEAEVEAQRAEVKNAELRVERLRETAETGATTRQEVDDAIARLEVAEARMQVRREALDLAKAGFREEDIAEAEARLKAQKARVELLETRLRDAVLKAPAPGVVQSRVLEPGELSQPGRPVLVIALTGEKWIRTYLPEPSLGKVERGMSAAVTTDSFPDKSYEGRVGFISPTSEFTPRSVETEDLRTQLVYETRILVDDPRNELRLGMPVSVTIDTGS